MLRLPSRRVLAVAVAITALLSLNLSALPAGAAWPGANGRVVFAREGQIVSRTVGSTTIKVLVAKLGREPSFSPSGKKIVFGRHSVTAFSWDLWTMNADGSGKRNITKSESRYERPAYSPNGLRIMYGECCGPMGDSKLFTLNAADGSAKRRFASKAGSMAAGAWSPNGAFVAYAGGPAGQPARLRRIRANGDASSVKLLSKVTNVESLDWSPDGKRLVFARITPSGSRVIYRVNADGSVLRKIADFSASDISVSDPAWSPRGTRIMFDRTPPNGGTSLWTMKPDGTDKRRFDTNGFDPTWQPVP